MSDERPFIKVSDTLADHPKFIALNDDAAGFMIVAIWGYCRHQNTDGLIPKAKAHRITKSANEVRCQKAIRVGLLEDAGDFYRCHDYLDHQQSAEQRSVKKAQARQAGRAGGLARANRTAKRSGSDPLTGTLSDLSSGIQAEVEVEVEQKTSSSVAAALSTLEGSRLLDGYLRRHGALPRDVKRKLGDQIDKLIADGIGRKQICGALDEWARRPDAAPGLLPHLVPRQQPELDPSKAWIREVGG